MIEVTLAWAEVRIAAEVAAVRRASALKSGRNHRHGATDADLSLDLEFNGVLGEIACCKWLGVYWPDFGLTPGTVDCGVCEVRAVDRPSKRLTLHDSDKANLPHVLAIISGPALVTLRGWIMGRDGKNGKYWSDPQGTKRFAYFVANEDLRPMDELRALLTSKAVAA